MESNTTTQTHPRRPIIAVVLSAITPGLGHVYAGNLKKGLLLSIFLHVALLNAGTVFDLSTFNATVLLWFLIIVFYLYVLISAFLLARKNKAYKLKKFNRWYIYLVMFVVVSVLSSLFSAYASNIMGAKLFRIPSGAMTPTLHVGDYVSLNTRYKAPIVGDVVVFIYPEDRSSNFVSRVAAVGGDTMIIKDGFVIRNGQAEPVLEVAAGNRQDKRSVTMESQIIPGDEFFVLGDWRDNSNDSRYWGTVPVSDVIGKVRYIWFSKTRDRIGKEVQ